MVDAASDGILVTDARGRVLYANAAYLELIGATDANDVRPIERAFIGDPDVSEAVYRLLNAAREGRRLQEEVRIGAHRGETGRWLRMRVRPLGAARREARMTVWSLADVTRELERQENVFQELQHAIDYLDHAPAGFFSAEANGSIVYLNATLANWLDHDLAQFSAGGLKLDDIVAGEGAALLTTLVAAPGEVRTEVFDIDLKTRGGRTVPVRLFHKVAFGADGAPGPSRTLVLNRARDDGTDPQRAAEVRFMRFFHNTPMAIATVDRAGRIAVERRVSPACSIRCARPTAPVTRPLDSRRRGRTRPRRARSGDPPWRRQGRATSRRSKRRSTAPSERFAQLLRDRDRARRRARPGSRHRLCARYHASSARWRTRSTSSRRWKPIGQLAGGIAHDFNNVLVAPS